MDIFGKPSILGNVSNSFWILSFTGYLAVFTIVGAQMVLYPDADCSHSSIDFTDLQVTKRCMRVFWSPNTR